MILKKSNNSSPGLDQIHYEILRYIHIETLHILLDIINETWKSDTFRESLFQFPNSERIILILLIIALLPSQVANVTVERMVNERLVWYLEKNGSLAKQQNGYRSNRSTVDHLVRLEAFIRYTLSKINT